MKMRTFIFFAAMLLTTALSAQSAYDGQLEMKEDMQIIVNELKLERDQIFDLGNIMEARRKEKEGVAQQINAVNERNAMIPEGATQDKAQITQLLTDMNAKMAASDAKAFDKISAMLTPSQQASFDKDVKAKLAEAQKARSETKK
jgi:Spy/CpxP family protein refolding chaperone